MDIEQISDEDRAQSYRDTHPQCIECGERGCPFKNDGTWAPEHFNCDGDGLEMMPTGEYIHVGCRSIYAQKMIRDIIKSGLLVRYGSEINELTASERANNLCIQVYEELRAHGYVEQKG